MVCTILASEHLVLIYDALKSAMGNVEMSTNLFKEYESSTGKLLIKAIRNNSQKHVSDAVEFARKQLATPNMNKSHQEDYNEMVSKMMLYLTRKYDVGDGMLYKKTPLELATSVEANEGVIEFLKETIFSLTHTKQESQINLEKSPCIKAAVGTVDQDRVSLAKSRLHVLRNKGNS